MLLRWKVIDFLVVVRNVVFRAVGRRLLCRDCRCRLPRRFSECRRLAIVEPFGKDVDGFVEVVDGHLVGGPAQPTVQRTNGLAKVHLALDDLLVGAEGALEALGEDLAFLCLDLRCSWVGYYLGGETLFNLGGSILNIGFIMGCLFVC